MDASTIVIIALFVVTIFSSFGGVSTPVSKPPTPPTTIHAKLPVYGSINPN